MQLWAVSRLATYQPDYHSVFYAIFRVYTNHKKEPKKIYDPEKVSIHTVSLYFTLFSKPMQEIIIGVILGQNAPFRRKERFVTLLIDGIIHMNLFKDIFLFPSYF